MARIIPEVKFDWLGELPELSEGARQRRVKQETLADLTSTDIGSLEKKAAQLMAAGLMDEGLKLQQAALARRSLNQQSADKEFYEKVIFPQLMRGMTPAGSPAAAGPVGTVFDPVSAAGEDKAPPARPAMPPVDFGPNPLAAPPKPQSMAPPVRSPSEDILAAAEDRAAPQMGRTQLAGPPQASTPQLPLSVYESARQMQGQAPTAAPPAAATPELNIPPPGGDPRQRLTSITRMLLSPRLPSHATQALMAEYRKEVDRLEGATTEQKDYLVDRIQRKLSGEPDIGIAEWRAEPKLVEGRHKELLKAYETTRTEGKRAEELLSLVNQMDGLMTD